MRILTTLSFLVADTISDCIRNISDESCYIFYGDTSACNVRLFLFRALRPTFLYMCAIAPGVQRKHLHVRSLVSESSHLSV